MQRPLHPMNSARAAEPRKLNESSGGGGDGVRLYFAIGSLVLFVSSIGQFFMAAN